VPGSDDTATIARTRRAIREIDVCEAYDQQTEEDHRAEQLGRWHDDDLVDEAADDCVGGYADEVDPILTRQPEAYDRAGLP
jgi:hypothetical protein